jgi:hypothetical protein
MSKLVAGAAERKRAVKRRLRLDNEAAELNLQAARRNKDHRAIADAEAALGMPKGRFTVPTWTREFRS